jgi:hypothetical protein
MSTATPEAPKKNRTVLDQHGQSYELTGRIGEGGQGIVCTTNYPNVLVKVARATTEEKRASWTNKIRALMRQPLEGLPYRSSASPHYAAAARLRHGTDGWTGPND